MNIEIEKGERCGAIEKKSRRSKIGDGSWSSRTATKVSNKNTYKNRVGLR